MKILFLVLVIFSFQACASASIQPNILVTLKSNFYHDKTVKMVKKFLKKKKLKVFSVIDHHKGAKKVKLNLDKTTLIIFGNPKVGTLMMQENQLIGLDLPMKILIHTSGNTTKMTYKKTDRLKDDYKISSNLDSHFASIEQLFERIAEYISKDEVKKK